MKTLICESMTGLNVSSTLIWIVPDESDSSACCSLLFPEHPESSNMRIKNLDITNTLFIPLLPFFRFVTPPNPETSIADAGYSKNPCHQGIEIKVQSQILVQNKKNTCTRP
jgi:hypothetical protein